MEYPENAEWPMEAHMLRWFDYWLKGEANGIEEDPAVRIVTNIVDCDPSRLEIDMPVRAVFRDLTFTDHDERVAAPFFVPVAPAAPKDHANAESA